MQSKPRNYSYSRLAAIFVFIGCVTHYCFATNNAALFCALSEQKSVDTAIAHLLQDYQPQPNPADNIAYFARIFLNKPYTLTALGEGHNGQFDQAPLYRVDTFDCQTYVETVLALALTHSLPNFKRCLQKIRYHSKQAGYTTRNHFMSPEWNEYNHKQGFIKDITLSLKNKYHHPVAKYAKATIDIPNWYQHFGIDKIRRCQTTPNEAKRYLQTLKQLGQHLPKKTSRVAYIPFTALFDTKGNPNMFLFDQIPSGAIIEIVRPNWDLTKLIGTHLNITHLGFAIREEDVLYFYQASSVFGKTSKSSLIDYLISIQSSPSIKGISIQKVLSATSC